MLNLLKYMHNNNIVVEKTSQQNALDSINYKRSQVIDTNTLNLLMKVIVY